MHTQVGHVTSDNTDLALIFNLASTAICVRASPFDQGDAVAQ